MGKEMNRLLNNPSISNIEKRLITDLAETHKSIKWTWSERISKSADRIYRAYLEDQGLLDDDDCGCQCDYWGE